MSTPYSPAPVRILQAIRKNINENTVRKNSWGREEFRNQDEDSFWSSWHWFSPCDYLNHVERYLPEGMTLDDYGKGKKCFAWDHIVPRPFWIKYFGPKLEFGSDAHVMRDSLMNGRPITVPENSANRDWETRMLPPDENPYFIELKHRFDALFDYDPYQPNYRTSEETLLLYAPITVSDWFLRRPKRPMFFACPFDEAEYEYGDWCDDAPDIEYMTDEKQYRLGLAKYLNYQQMKSQAEGL